MFPKVHFLFVIFSKEMNEKKVKDIWKLELWYIHVTLLVGYGKLKLEREKRELMFDKRVWIGEISCGGSLLAA
jgi:hypothetical protein